MGAGAVGTATLGTICFRELPKDAAALRRKFEREYLAQILRITEGVLRVMATNRVAPEQHAGAWGGFIMRGAGAELVANGAIMTGAGAPSRSA